MTAGPAQDLYGEIVLVDASGQVPADDASGPRILRVTGDPNTFDPALIRKPGSLALDTEGRLWQAQTDGSWQNLGEGGVQGPPTSEIAHLAAWSDTEGTAIFSAGATLGEVNAAIQNAATPGEKEAMVGSTGTPSNTNVYITNDDPRNSDSREPIGAAGGDLQLTYPNPQVLRARGLLESGGATLAMGAVSDGQMLVRSGLSLIGVAAAVPQTLAATLVQGFLSGALNIEMQTGTYGVGVIGEDAAGGSGLPGSPLLLRPGHGDGAGADGAIIFGSEPGSATGALRGENAFDTQRVRGAATQIASGPRSALIGGRFNTNAWQNSVILGGDSNSMLGYGYNNVMAGGYSSFNGNGGSGLYNSAIFGSYHDGNSGATYGPYGRSNLITGFSFRSLGYYNYMRGNILGAYVNQYEYVYLGHSVAGGQSIRAMGYFQTSMVWGRQLYLGNASSGFAIGYSAIFGSQHFIARYGGDFDYGLVAGGNHTADEAIAGIVLSGRFAHASISGMRVHALALPGTGFPSTRPGSAQANEVPLAARTTVVGPTEMRTTISPSGKQNKYLLDAGSLQLFRILITARQETAGPGAEAAAWEVVGAIHNDGGTTALLPAGGGTGLVVTLIGETAGVGALGWAIAVTADNVDDELVISVTGDASGTPVRWFGWVVASNVGQGV
jgi:hypothetical protein